MFSEWMDMKMEWPGTDEDGNVDRDGSGYHGYHGEEREQADGRLKRKCRREEDRPRGE